MIWSFCNGTRESLHGSPSSLCLTYFVSLSEVGCNNESSAALFRAISYYYDGSRGTTQNRKGEGDHPLSAKSLDVQGFSHKKDKDFEKFHKDNPEKPMMATEDEKEILMKTPKNLIRP